MLNQTQSKNDPAIDEGTDTADVMQLRDAANFSVRHRLLRAVFGAVWLLLAAWTPPQMTTWRLALLRVFGARLHSTASVRGGARIWYPPNLTMHPHSVLADGVICYNMAPIIIGEKSIVSQRAVLCGGTHDFTKGSNPLITRPIKIGANVWVASEAFVGPGVEVPDGCVIGARAVVTGRLEPWTVYAGNPARPVKRRDYDPQS